MEMLVRIVIHFWKKMLQDIVYKSFQIADKLKVIPKLEIIVMLHTAFT